MYQTIACSDLLLSATGKGFENMLCLFRIWSRLLLDSVVITAVVTSWSSLSMGLSSLLIGVVVIKV